MKKILVTGAHGQLGKCLKDASRHFPKLAITFKSKEDLNIENKESLENIFKSKNFDYCINTAAYTLVEKAESESKKAFSINAEAVKNIALVCKKHQTVLIHISTDYVFDGEKQAPYNEEDKTNPINVYGASKLKGEEHIKDILKKYFIFRTSWLYSQYGHNFYNSILKNSKEGKKLTITTEQVGTPTNANDISNAILNVISSGSNNYGIYNYSNSGEATWFDFAKEILRQTKHFEPTKLAKTDHYRTFAARPKYSVLDNTKYNNEFKYNCFDWKNSLETVIKKR